MNTYIDSLYLGDMRDISEGDAWLVLEVGEGDKERELRAKNTFV